MEELERLLKALADKNRLRIIKLLEARKMCVCELAFVIGITQPSVSRHLKKLSTAGIVACEQDRFWTNYYLRQDNNSLKALLSCFKKHLNSDVAIKEDLEKLKRVNRTKLCCKK
jgi:ArsR family transcriptional regulator